MADLNGMFNGSQARREDSANHPKRITKWIHYSKLVPSTRQYRDKEKQREREEALASLILADGEVLQDLIVRKTDADEYEIISGHTRLGACRILAEENGDERFAFLPCIVKDVSDAKAAFQVVSSNGYSEKTPYEQMHEIEEMKHLIETYPEEFPDLGRGRMVEKLARQLDIARSTVSEFLSVSRNLSDKGMELFESGELKKSAAVELASLDKEEQDSLLDGGARTLKEIRDAKAESPDPGNVPDSGTREPAEKLPPEEIPIEPGDAVRLKDGDDADAGLVTRIDGGTARLVDLNGYPVPQGIPLTGLVRCGSARRETAALFAALGRILGK